MLEVLSIIAIIAAGVLGIAFLLLVCSFLWYFNQLFNHVLYMNKETINYGIEELPDEINIDDLLEDLNSKKQIYR